MPDGCEVMLLGTDGGGDGLAGADRGRYEFEDTAGGGDGLTVADCGR